MAFHVDRDGTTTTGPAPPPPGNPRDRVSRQFLLRQAIGRYGPWLGAPDAAGLATLGLDAYVLAHWAVRPCPVCQPPLEDCPGFTVEADRFARGLVSMAVCRGCQHAIVLSELAAR
jgi:hypothetical protein